MPIQYTPERRALLADLGMLPREEIEPLPLTPLERNVLSQVLHRDGSVARPSQVTKSASPMMQNRKRGAWNSCVERGLIERREFQDGTRRVVRWRVTDLGKVSV